MAIEIRAYCNEDEAEIVWRADARIPGCRGFAIERDAKDGSGKESTTTLETSVGFQGETPAPPVGTTKPSSAWPIQRFLWRDFAAGKFAQVRYRVRPMLGTATALVAGDDSTCSPWSDWLAIGTGHSAGFAAHFNRGVVSAQWLSRWLKVPPAQQHAALSKVIADPTSPIRRYLGGGDMAALKALLADVKANGQTIYAALYELDDPELIAALTDIGANANVLLSSGAFDPKKDPDENAAVRQQLKTKTNVHVFDRLVTGSHFAHNKFMVVCDPSGTPLRVWTGSTNWTMTGLCTQANNAVLVDDAGLAAGYLAYWHRLQAAGNGYPPSLAAADATPVTTTVGGASITAWLTPVHKTLDLAAAKKLIDGATQGVLFLMFIPGPHGTLLNDILALNDRKLFVHGVVNSDPGGGTLPKVQIVSRGAVLEADPEVILPAAIDTTLEFWQPELRQYSTAMVHSKVVVVDPFGPHPVVMTGSHNMGPKASGQNDDNLIIIENASGLAMEYAVNVMGVYDQYKWRYNQLVERQQKAGAGPKTAPGGNGAAPASGRSAPAPGSATAVAAAASTAINAAATLVASAATAVAPAPDAAAPGKPASQQWAGLQDDDTWQDEFFVGARARELRFLFGESTALPDA